MQTYPPGIVRKIRDRMASVIAEYSANDVPSVCRRFGLADGSRSEAYQGKFKYVSARLLELPNQQIVETARAVAQEEGDAELIALIESAQPQADVQPEGFYGRRRVYYAERSNADPKSGTLDFETLKELFKSEYESWEEAGYFQQHFGFSCVDVEHVKGTLGGNIDAKMTFAIGRSGLWPIRDQVGSYPEDEFFSVLEFVFDYISKPTKGTMHDWYQCGMHWEEFDQTAGRNDYRRSVNALLARYGDGYELSPNGEVMQLGPKGTATLLATEIPVSEENIKGRVDAAVTKFRQRRSSTGDRRDAVRDLADVLEYLRPELKQVLTKADEKDLFNIANNFSIRHHRADQKSDYDPAIWLSWMFYFYLATIHASVRLIEKAKLA